MAKKVVDSRIKIKVFDGTGKKVLGFGYIIGHTDVWVIEMPDGSIRSLKDAKKRPTNRSGGTLQRILNNPKIRLDKGRIVYGCQVWWELVRPLACLDGKTLCEPNKKPVGFCAGCGG